MTGKDDAKSSVNVYETLSLMGAPRCLDRQPARNYLERTIGKWLLRPMPRWREERPEDLPPADVVDFYQEYPYALLALLRDPGESRDHLEELVSRVLDGQDQDGSWGGLTLSLYTAHIVRVLNEYYELTGDGRVFEAIEKANAWQLQQIDEARRAKGRETLVYVLCCYYAIGFANMPAAILEHRETRGMVEELKYQYYLRATTTAVAGDPIDYLDEVTGWLVYALIRDPGGMVPTAEKESLCGEAIRDVLWRQRENGGWGRNLSMNNNVTCMALRLLTAARDHVVGAEREMVEEALDAGISYLMTNQTQDGGWPIGERLYSSYSMTALNTICLLRSHRPEVLPAALRGVRWLEGSYGRRSQASENPPSGAVDKLPSSANGASEAETVEAFVEAYRVTKDKQYLSLPMKIVGDLHLHDLAGERRTSTQEASLLATAWAVEMISDLARVTTLKGKTCLDAWQAAAWIESRQENDGGWKASISFRERAQIWDVTPLICEVLQKMEQAGLGRHERSISRGIGHLYARLHQYRTYEELRLSCPEANLYVVYSCIILGEHGSRMKLRFEKLQETVCGWVEEALARGDNPRVKSFLIYGLVRAGWCADASRVASSGR